MLGEFTNFYSNIILIIKISLTIIVPLILYKILEKSIHSFESYDSISINSLNLLLKIVRYLIFIIIIMGILNVLGINIQSLIISLGLVSLALTLAAKDTLSNVISGTILLLEKRFVVGDMIEIDGHKGQVKKIGFKSVELCYKKTYTVIPNVLFTTKPFINHTRNGYYAIFFDIKILNKYNLDEKIAQLEKILSESDLILHDPDYVIMIKKITTEGVEITVKSYISNPLDNTKTVTELIKKIKREIVLEDID